MQFNLITHTNNPPDTRFMVTDRTKNWGHVPYEYLLSKYLITQQEYCNFLNEVAIQEDTHNLFSPLESFRNINDSNNQHNIFFENNKYNVKNGFENKPVVNIDFYSACRFCNWMHNECPINTIQDNYSTEDGAYNFLSRDLVVIQKNNEAKYWIPSDNEWYKAAYYDHKRISGKPAYWLYPNKSDSPPIPSTEKDYFSINTDNVFNGLSDVNYFDIYNTSYFDIVDMGGNVYEWISDIIDSKFRIVRGGSYNRSRENAASVYRRKLAPELKLNHVGFRICKISSTKTISIGLYNTYGDGWKNSTIDIYDNNHKKIISNEFLDFGYGPKCIDLSLPLGCDYVNIVYNSNNNKYSYENYIKIFDNTGLSGSCLFTTKEHEEIPSNINMAIN